MSHWQPSGLASGAQQQARSLHAPYTTQRDPYPLPAQSLRPDPLADVERNRAAGLFATIVLSLVFAVPMICAGVILHFR